MESSTGIVPALSSALKLGNTLVGVCYGSIALGTYPGTFKST